MYVWSKRNSQSNDNTVTVVLLLLNPLIDAELMLSCLLLLLGGAVSVTPCPGEPACDGCDTGDIDCRNEGLTSFPEFPVEVQESATRM